MSQPRDDRQDDLFRQKVPIDLPRQPHQRMAKVDDLGTGAIDTKDLEREPQLSHRSR
jgi:hypothetical protein